MGEKLTNSLLYLDGVSVSFDGFKALNKLSLVIEPGEMRAIIGQNGAGKTTMMDVITGRNCGRGCGPMRKQFAARSVYGSNQNCPRKWPSRSLDA